MCGWSSAKLKIWIASLGFQSYNKHYFFFFLHFSYFFAICRFSYRCWLYYYNMSFQCVTNLANAPHHDSIIHESCKRATPWFHYTLNGVDVNAATHVSKFLNTPYPSRYINYIVNNVNVVVQRCPSRMSQFVSVVSIKISI